MSTDSSTYLPLGVTLAQGYSSSLQSGQITTHNLTMAVHGGTGGAGGSANEQGGAGGIGQGPNFQINTQYMVLGQQQTPADEALPVNINCPPPSKYFEGREEILDQLNKCFEVHTLQEQIVVLLHGLGGVGKTQIALKFLASSSQRFVKIFKVTASSVETIRAGYQSIAKDEQVGGSMNDALTWLQSTKTEWMILFDNADKPELNLGEFLPECQHGNILITSRNPALAIHTGVASRSIQVQDLENEAASALFCKISHMDVKKNKDHVQLLLRELHFFPLAIVQAAAYISQSHTMQQDMSKYMQLYKQKRKEILSYKPPQRSWDYEATVYTTWQISFSQLSGQAQKFLQVCSFLHYEGITEHIFEIAARYELEENLQSPRARNVAAVQEFLHCFQDDRDEWNSWAFAKLLTDICSYSLLMPGVKGGYSMHPLVREWVQLLVQDKIQMKLFTLWLLAISVDGREKSVDALQLVLHLLNVDNDDFFIQEGFQRKVFHIYRDAGAFHRATGVADKWRESSVKINGANSLETLNAMQCLGLAHGDMGRHADAQHLREQVLQMCRQTLGEDHPDTALAMGNLARTYSELGRHANALKLEEQVLQMRRHTLGDNHPDTALAMGNLARTYSQLGRHADALKLEEQVLQIRRQTLGKDHPDTALAMGNLAVTYSELGRHADALKLEEQVLQMRRQTLGEAHPRTFLTMGNLAGTYSELGRHADALKLEDQVLQMQRQTLGENHPHTVLAMGNLAAIYTKLGRHVDALKLEEKVLQMYRHIFGEDHPDTVLAMGNLAIIYTKLGRHADALNLEESVLQMRRQTLGENHPDTVLAMGNLAITYSKLERQADALELKEQVLQIRRQTLGEDHPSTVLAMGNLARTYRMLKRYADALELEEQVLQIHRHTLGEDHPH